MFGVRWLLKELKDIDSHFFNTPLLSHVVRRGSAVEWYEFNRPHIMVTTVNPCNSPLLENMKFGRPSTGPVPIIAIEGSVMWDGFPVDIIQACVTRPNFASTKNWRRISCPWWHQCRTIVWWETTDPQIFCNAGDSAKKDSQRDLGEIIWGVLWVLMLEFPPMEMPWRV